MVVVVVERIANKEIVPPFIPDRRQSLFFANFAPRKVI